VGKVVRKKLTKQVVDKYKYSNAQQQWFLWDEGDGSIKGFGVRITKSAKAFIFEGRVNRRSLRYTIGRFPDWSIDLARDRARELSVMCDRGIDPREADRETAAKAKTLGSIFEEYISERTLKPRTRFDYTGYIQKYFADWATQPASKLTTDAVLTRHKELAASHGDAQANVAFRMLRAVLNYAEDVLPENVTRILSKKRAWKPAKARTDYLSRSQVGPFVSALSEWQGNASGGFVEFLLCSGCRSVEARNLTWNDVDLKARELVFIDTKNNKDRKIPIASRVLATLVRMSKTRIRGNPFVFASVGKKGNPIAVVDVRKCLAFLNEKARSVVTPHGLRRTATTLLANDLNCPTPVYKRILGHTVVGDVTEQFYRQFTVEDARPWLEKLDALITELVQAHSSQE
jgi:integrase